jgi:hypothetical protein
MCGDVNLGVLHVLALVLIYGDFLYLSIASEYIVYKPHHASVTIRAKGMDTATGDTFPLTIDVLTTSTILIPSSTTRFNGRHVNTMTACMHGTLKALQFLGNSVTRRGIRVRVDHGQLAAGVQLLNAIRPIPQ